MYGTVGPRKPNKTSYDSSVIAILLLDGAKDQVDNRTQELDVQLVWSWCVKQWLRLSKLELPSQIY